MRDFKLYYKSTEMHENLISIPLKEYKSLLCSQAKLDALEAGGVDNWEFYDVSLEDFYEMFDDGEWD